MDFSLSPDCRAIHQTKVVQNVNVLYARSLTYSPSLSPIQTMGTENKKDFLRAVGGAGVLMYITLSRWSGDTRQMPKEMSAKGVVFEHG